MSLRESFRRGHPAFPLLLASDPAGVERLLRELGWIESGERVLGCERAGEGNMNLTLRVRTERRSLIVKQSRPWVEKYDTIAAPFDRALVEQAFYERVAGIRGVAAVMPRLLAADPASRTLLLEDLGEARDLTSLYDGDRLSVVEARELGGYLRELHEATRGSDPGGLENREMRALNREHLFVVPLERDNGVDLEGFEPGLEAVAGRLRDDDAVRRVFARLAERYLASGPSLVHGDFFPGSWLRTAKGLRVLDPEFGHFGDPELDLGVACAHLALARQPVGVAEALLVAATETSGVDEALLAELAGVEIVRRLLGVAQLPIPPSDGFRAELLERARRALLEKRWEVLW